QVQPAEAVVDEGLVLGPVALHVGIVDAQYEGALVLAREEHVVERRARGPKVSEPGGARRDPDANGHRHILRTCRNTPVCSRSSVGRSSNRATRSRTDCWPRRLEPGLPSWWRPPRRGRARRTRWL